MISPATPPHLSFDTLLMSKRCRMMLKHLTHPTLVHESTNVTGHLERPSETPQALIKRVFDALGNNNGLPHHTKTWLKERKERRRWDVKEFKQAAYAKIPQNILQVKENPMNLKETEGFICSKPTRNHFC